MFFCLWIYLFHFQRSKSTCLKWLLSCTLVSKILVCFSSCTIQYIICIINYHSILDNVQPLEPLFLFPYFYVFDLKLRCDERCGCVFKEITLFGSNQGNYFENATACSKRTLKTTVATKLNRCILIGIFKVVSVYTVRRVLFTVNLPKSKLNLNRYYWRLQV